MWSEAEPPRLPDRAGVTEEEFYSLEGPDSPWEFLGGRLVISPSSYRQENLFRFLLTLFSSYLDATGAGQVSGSRYPMRLDPRWSPEPDLLVVKAENAHRMTEKYLDGPADLVIEIASDWDRNFEKREKLPRYREAQVPEIWLIEPHPRRVQVQRLAGGSYTTETLTRGPLSPAMLPGFAIEVSWLWESKLPSTYECLKRLLG